jgi:ATP-dependent protease ClpP protease subunit
MTTQLLRSLADVEHIQRPTRPLAMRGRREWYRIENKSDDEATIYIYDEIGYWGTRASQFVKDLQGVTTKRIALHLNTPGGDVFDGIAILNALRAHPATVTVTVDSLAASIGSVIAMAGERIVMAKHSTLMIHDPATLAWGDAAEMRKTAEILDQLGDTIAGVYAERAGGSVREWRDRMLEETWYTDREAVDAGLADEVDGDADADVENVFDLSVFKHPPEHLMARGPADNQRQPTKRDIERALRDAGLSRAKAKAFVAAAWGQAEPEDETRDVSDLIALLDALKILNRGDSNA